MKRTPSFIIISILYVLAFVVGLLVYQLLGWSSIFLKIVVADIVATIFIWCTSVLFKNSSIYDPYWSVAPMVIVPFLVIEWNLYSIMMVLVVFYWGIRLTSNWAYTFKGLKYQDWRYTHFQNSFPKTWQFINLFGIHLFPTLIVVGALIPVHFYLQSSGTVTIFTVFGALVSVASVTLQLVSDSQMHRFRKENPGKVFDEGLWKYSRHPNYFGEIMMWWGVWLMAVSINVEYVFLAFGPLLNTLMFIFISIPLMENRQVERKEEYGLYLQTTRALLPWPKKAKESEKTI